MASQKRQIDKTARAFRDNDLPEKLAKLGPWAGSYSHAAAAFFSSHARKVILLRVAESGVEFRLNLFEGYGNRLGELVDAGHNELIIHRGRPAYHAGRIPASMDTFVDRLIEAVGGEYAERAYVNHPVFSRGDFEDFATAITYALPIHRTVVIGYEAKPTKEGCVIVRRKI